MARLANQTVLITGAKGGLGSFVTRAFLDEGAAVYGASRSIRAADFGHPAFHPVSAELTTAEAFSDLLSQPPRVDAVVHLIGGFAGGALVDETDTGTLESMLDANLRSAFFLARAVLPRMRAQRYGRFLAVGSRSALEPSARTAAYNLSKAALVSLIKTIALENQRYGVTANVVLPGTMDTPANRAAMPDNDPSQWVQPAQVAQLLVHLASPEAANINGAAVPIYGLVE
jgi:NAD(P)-dependent dehydrogenase (short-subunit alcohol dehydrogenase family)